MVTGQCVWSPWDQLPRVIRFQPKRPGGRRPIGYLHIDKEIIDGIYL